MIDADLAIRISQNAHLPPCMGGWCVVRDTCARYWDRSRRSAAERLCAPGFDDQHVPLYLPTTNTESTPQ